MAGTPNSCTEDPWNRKLTWPPAGRYNHLPPLTKKKCKMEEEKKEIN
jgi:hypothetical protein